MVSEQQATYSLNIGLHMLILFTFLTVFFFIIITNTEKKSINQQLDKVTNQTTIYNILDNIQNIKDYGITINWNGIYNSAKNISNKSQGTDPNIDSQNKKLKIISLIIIGTFTLILISMYLYYRFALKLNVHLWHIFAENAIIFLFIGLVEYIFFMQIVSNYIPVTSSYVADSILDRFKERIQENNI